MAAGSVRTLQELEAEVNCPVCKDTFNNPKRLPCDHVYCMKCLSGLASRSTTRGIISCPECRAETNFDLAQFATPHRVNRLVEMYQRSLKRAKTEAEMQPATCKEHKSQPLALYCETCESLVCRDCVIDSCSKNSHEFEYVDILVKKYEADFNKKLEPVTTLLQKISANLSALSTAQTEMANHEESKIQLVESTFDALAHLLDSDKCYFLASIKKSFQNQKMTFAAKKEEISKVLGKLDLVVQSAERAFRACPNLALMEMDYQDIVQQASSTMSTGPAALPESLEVEMASPEQFLEHWHASSFLYKSEDPLKSHLHSHHLELDIPINQTASYVFSVDLRSLKKKRVLITASLLCCRDGTSEAVAVGKITPEQYSLSFVPQKRGRHELHIMYNDTRICGSPIPVYVSVPPQQLNEGIAMVEVAETVYGGIRCYNGKVCISREEDIVVMDSLTGLAEKYIPVSAHCNAILVTSEHIFATEDDQVVKMDWNGTVLKSAAGVGSNRLGLFNGIRRNHTNNKILVCDRQNHRIHVFDEELNFVQVFGKKGSEDGCFESPTELDFDEAGNIYVVEQRKRVQVLTPEGQHIRYIGQELNSPISIAVHRGLVYVVEEDRCIVFVFTLIGELVTSFTCENSHPVAIAVDKDGYLYVISSKTTQHSHLNFYSEPWTR